MDIAQKSFEIANDVETIDANDAIFKYDKAEQMTLLDDPPWAKDPHWFKEVKISAVALIKMVIHARSGGQYEIMGLMNGKIHNQTFYVLDSFALPVQGTETRVNAGDAAMEYMVQFTGGNEEIGKQELVVGWYHSHPGYGCWLSGIDVNTQAVQQKHNDPYLAVVIDPNRTVSAGKVEIGAFRTYPEGYTPPDSKSSDYQSIPLDKIEDFGVHANSYYPLKVSVFKSSLDAKLLESLWNKYWVNTLSQSTIISSRPYASSQLKDLTAKLSQAESRISKDRHAESMTITRKIGKSNNGEEDVGVKWEEKETALRKVSKDGQRISAEAQNGILAQEFKSTLFNRNLKFESPLPAQPRVPSDPTASAQALDPASSADPISLSQSETPQPA